MRRFPLVPSVLALSLILAVGCANGGVERYDVVIAEGRVMDPESGLDAVRWIGIQEDRIAAISESPLEGVLVLDAAGLVVSPGFIDLHAHGQDDENYRLFAMNGVTTALEMEVGTADVEGWYAAREGRALLNHGVSVGHVRLRMEMYDDVGDLLPSGPGGYSRATGAELDHLRAGIGTGLDGGALGVGFGQEGC